MTLESLLVFIITLGILVFFHELGHFIMAKRAGAKVEEFGFGFPPRIFGVKRGETTYSINLIPLGGFVNILGENGENKEDNRSFASKTVWQRFQILAAGVTANVLLAIVLFSMVAYIGFPRQYTDEEAQNIDNARIIITEVVSNLPAAEAGIQPGDQILSLKVDGTGEFRDIKKVKDVKEFIKTKLDQTIDFNLMRGSKSIEIKVKTVPNSDNTEAITGIALEAMSGPVSAGLVGSIKIGLESTWDFATLIIFTVYYIIKELFTTGTTTENLSGPVGIAVMVGQMTQLGIVYVLRFMAILSVNLAVINALPFPALDGGRILFLLIEKIKGKPVSAETEGKFHFAGMALLLLLMALVTFRDIGTYHIWQKITSLF